MRFVGEHEDDVILQRDVPMRKTYRNVKLAPRFSRKFCRDMLAKLPNVGEPPRTSTATSRIRQKQLAANAYRRKDGAA